MLEKKSLSHSSSVAERKLGWDVLCTCASEKNELKLQRNTLEMENKWSLVPSWQMTTQHHVLLRKLQGAAGITTQFWHKIGEGHVQKRALFDMQCALFRQHE